MFSLQQVSSSPPLPRIDLSSSTQNIVIIDGAVKNYQYLLASPLLGMEVHILSDQTDGIAQTKALLSQGPQFSSLHLICNGGPGQLQMGTTDLNEDNLWAYADGFRQWRPYLAANAEVYIYGCELAVSRAGQALVSWLGLLTGAKVTALS